MKKDSTNSMSWVLLIILSIIWGSSFILMKRALFTPDGEVIFDSQQVAALRIGLAALESPSFGHPSYQRTLQEECGVPALFRPGR